MHNFSETTKLVYHGEQDDRTSSLLRAVYRIMTSFPEKMFHFTCFNTEDPHDPQVGLRNGDLTIPGNLLRQEVFDPVVKQVRYHAPAIALPCSYG